jgi:hypothetical protein
MCGIGMYISGDPIQILKPHILFFSEEFWSAIQNKNGKTRTFRGVYQVMSELSSTFPSVLWIT